MPGGASGQPAWITTGPDGNLWFTEIQGSRVGRITPHGTVTTFATPTPKSGPAGITAGPDGDLWFIEGLAHAVGRITPSGRITEFPLHAASQPVGIATGPDGNLWFTEAGATNAIGRLTPPAGAPAASGPPPVLGRHASATAVAGQVFVKRAGAHSFALLSGSSAIPFGSIVDATGGIVKLTTATAAGGTQTARFYAGRFALTQAHSGATKLTLDARLSCPHHAALARAPPRRQRSLWGSGHGTFTTDGRYASATVLGTKWLTTDHLRLHPHHGREGRGPRPRPRPPPHRRRPRAAQLHRERLTATRGRTIAR